MSKADVVIVGAGVAGLCCARRLRTAGISCLIVEATDGVGGRVRTDEVDGFLLDRGFQVLLTAYPEANRILDYGALDLRPFYPGALVHFLTQFHRVVDPWRRPVDALLTFLSPVTTLRDKLKLAELDWKYQLGTVDDIWSKPDRTTIEELTAAGFAPTTIDRFFKPFFGGVFLDRDLTTSSRLFEFVFRMFTQGDTTLPARGMGSIPGQIAARLHERGCEVRTSTRAASLAPGGIRLDTGEEIRAGAVVVATGGDDAASLLGPHVRAADMPPPFAGWRAAATVYFSCEEPPVQEPILVLDGECRGPVNHVCVPSNVAPTYAPRGRCLISANLIGDPGPDEAATTAAVLSQMHDWFGPGVEGWRHLRTYRIPRALPVQAPGPAGPRRAGVRVSPGLYVCGDYLDNASINGAMESGRRAAESVLEDLTGVR